MGDAGMVAERGGGVQGWLSGTWLPGTRRVTATAGTYPEGGTNRSPTTRRGCDGSSAIPQTCSLKASCSLKFQGNRTRR